MKTQEVQFGGNNYPCRVVESNEGEELLIGSITLLDALQPGSFNDENEGFASGKSSVSCPLKPSDSAPLKHSTMPP